MATGPRYKVAFRRRRDNSTDYYIRKKLLSGGESRAVVRRSSKYVKIQFVDFTMEGDKIISSTTSKELKAMGWEYACSSIPAAYVTGYIAGKKAVAAGLSHAILDIGMQTPSKGAVLFATVAGMKAAGLDVPHGEEVIPVDERLYGDHIDAGIRSKVEEIMGGVASVGKKKDAKKAPAKASKEDAKKAPAKASKEDAKKAPAKASKEDAKKAPAKAKKKEA